MAENEEKPCCGDGQKNEAQSCCGGDTPATNEESCCCGGEAPPKNASVSKIKTIITGAIIIAALGVAAHALINGGDKEAACAGKTDAEKQQCCPQN